MGLLALYLGVACTGNDDAVSESSSAPSAATSQAERGPANAGGGEAGAAARDLEAGASAADSGLQATAGASGVTGMTGVTTGGRSAPGTAAPSGGDGSIAGGSGAAGMSAMDGSAGVAGEAAPSSMSMAACDRACLTGFNDAYLAALVANDASQLDTASDVRFTENGKELQLGEGLWAVARELGAYRQDMAEVPAGQTAGFVSLEDDRGDVLLAFRLKVVEQKVTEIETTVCRSGEATFFSPASLMHNPLYDEAVEPDARLPREELTRIVDLYFNGIETSDGSAIPFADSARRNENGSVTGMGAALKNVAMFSYIEQIDRRYVLVDEERGNVLPWVLFQIPNGFTGSRTLHLAELFKVQGGEIRDVQAIMVNQPLGTPSGWE